MKKHLFIIILIASSYVLSLLAIPFCRMKWRFIGMWLGKLTALRANGGAHYFSDLLTGIVSLILFLPKVDPRKETTRNLKSISHFLHVFVYFYLAYMW